LLNRVAFIDVDVKDCEKVLSLNEQDWDGKELVVKIDETTNIRKKKVKSDHKGDIDSLFFLLFIAISRFLFLFKSFYICNYLILKIKGQKLNLHCKEPTKYDF